MVVQVDRIGMVQFVDTGIGKVGRIRIRQRKMIQSMPFLHHIFGTIQFLNHHAIDPCIQCSRVAISCQDRPQIHDGIFDANQEIVAVGGHAHVMGIIPVAATNNRIHLSEVAVQNVPITVVVKGQPTVRMQFEIQGPHLTLLIPDDIAIAVEQKVGRRQEKWRLHAVKAHQYIVKANVAIGIVPLDTVAWRTRRRKLPADVRSQQEQGQGEESEKTMHIFQERAT